MEPSWRALLVAQLALPLSVLLGGVLLHSMNVLITATLLPSIVADVGGSNLMSWPTTAFVASSIVAATSTAIVSSAVGNRRAFCGGAVIYAAGAVLCALASSMGIVIAGRFVQGLGGGLLSALAYVLVRNVFPEVLWPRVFGLFAGVWSVSVPVGPLIGGLFAGYGNWRGAFFAVAGVGGLLGVTALFILPSAARSDDATKPKVPALRVALICAAIALLSLASVSTGPAIKSVFIVAAIGTFGLTLRIDRRIIPEENSAEAEQALTDHINWVCGSMPGIKVVIRRVLLAEPFRIRPGQEKLTALLQKHGEAIMGEPIPAGGVPIYTDARLYSEAGVPTVLYGAGPHTLLDANGHRADEKLVLEDLRKATQVVALTLADLLTSEG